MTNKSEPIIYSQDAIYYHCRILTTPFDGSEVNRKAKQDAVIYLRGWIKHLRDFASLSDTRVSEICNNSAHVLTHVISTSSFRDGIDW